ncbi:MAG: hypothetical protein DA443_04295 [Bacteroidetes bacterium]|nr:MAG: hypothetical protein DA443_04295 [Bacteroidota bacterium]
MKQKRNESRFHSQSAPAQLGALAQPGIPAQRGALKQPGALKQQGTPAQPGTRALLSLQHRAEDNQTKV